MNDSKAETLGQDEEYQFDDFDKFDATDDSAVAPGAESASPQPEHEAMQGFEPQKDHRKLIVIGVIVAVLVGLGVYSMSKHFGGVTIPKEVSSFPGAATPHTNTDAMPTAAPAVANSATNSSTAVQVAPVAAVAPSATASDIDHLTSTIAAQQQTIDQMQTSINSLQDAVGALNSTLGDVSQQLTTTLNKVAQPVVRTVVKTVPVVAPPPRPVYTIRALVPGRAWLQSTDGQSITVVNGDTVPGYGTVQDIDLNGGQVVLSDGTLIGYNLNS